MSNKKSYRGLILICFVVILAWIVCINIGIGELKH